MSVKLYYVNQYGQMLRPDGKPFAVTSSSREYFEIYETVEQAETVANKFAKEHPLFGCFLSHEGGQESYVYGDDETFQKEYSQFIGDSKASWRKWRKRDLLIVLAFFIGITVLAFVVF